MGTPQAAVPSLEKCLTDGHEVAAVYTQPDRPSGRGNKITFSPVKEFAIANSLPVYQPIKIKTAETIEEFRSHAADVVVVVAYGRILPESYLKAFPQGAVNVHFSLLPKYRGAAPVNWAIVNGESETGVTTMQMDVGLDTGPILLQRSTPIGPDETAVELMSRLSVFGADLLSETLNRLDAISPVEQDHAAATFAPIMNREDGRIDWQLSAQQISDRVRGFQPFPATFTYHSGTKLTIWKASHCSDPEVQSSAPGEVLVAHNDRLLVACGDDSVIEITEIQPEGKRRMSVRDFLNGTKLQTGAILGG